ncbi:MAG: acyl-CoA carboxylase subunit beta [Halobacteria archaeon]
MEDKIQELRRKREEALEGGGQERIDKQHDKGKLTARERIEYLVDDGSFNESDPFVEHRTEKFGMGDRKIPGDGVVVGYGDINGRKTCIFAHDFTVFGGSVSETVAEKVAKIMDRAVENGVPVVGLNDSAGARIQEGIASLAGYAEIFRRNVEASGVVPQISVIMGPCAGGAVYSPAMTDFTFMVDESSHMMITGPNVIKQVTGEDVSFEELGGAHVHTNTSGVADASYRDDEAALDAVKTLLSYLPQNNLEDPPSYRGQDPPENINLNNVVPDEPRKPYDMKDVIRGVCDEDSFFEVKDSYARNVVTGFARIDGRSIGVVANQPRINAGTLDIDSSMKGARFVRTCDAYNVPILTFVDVPGFMPGKQQEHGGIIKHGAKILYAYSEATVPLVTVITRKAYGGAYVVMGSKYLDADFNYAWPTAEVAVMGPEGAVEILYGDEISEAEDPEAKKNELKEEFREEFANPYNAAERGYVDDVIEPEETRGRVADDLDLIEDKRKELPGKKHGNVPL